MNQQLKQKGTCITCSSGTHIVFFPPSLFYRLDVTNDTTPTHDSPLLLSSPPSLNLSHPPSFHPARGGQRGTQSPRPIEPIFGVYIQAAAAAAAAVTKSPTRLAFLYFSHLFLLCVGASLFSSLVLSSWCEGWELWWGKGVQT